MRVVIIGGTAAGMTAAAKLRRVDTEAEIIVYEKRDYASFGACGLPYFVGNFFESTNNMIARTKEQIIASGIELLAQHEVVNIDVNEKKVIVKNLLTGEEFSDNYDKLMIATGATPMIPPIKNVELENVFTLHSMEDGIALKKAMENPELKNVVIIGAGFIGLELVEAAKQYGKEVHVFQRGDRILDVAFDKEITDILEEELSNHNVNLSMNSTVTEFKGNEKVEGVVVGDKTFDAHIVVLATGVRPNTGFIANTGIEMSKNGAIIIDNKGETSIKDIYAAGDCAIVPHMLQENSYIPLATNANKLGRIVGENLGGLNSVYQSALGSSCIKVLDMEAGRTGLSEEDAKKLGINYSTKFISDMNQTDYYPGQEKIYVKVIYAKDSKVLLGGQVVGKKDAVQRTNVLATAIYNKMTTAELGMLDLCYAPPFARTWDVLNVVGNVSK
ncbi:CoA-disulfide reductase [Clostridium massiliamazoniense]|uniref:CoA-disulfide reductase n=1 Tax=Clostridium massiliamazoniense TaxID=1347366 RepID=UPI0006D7BE3A|nr:CoA-disulfide reductase [Clostridium massiliamazoniense]